MHAQRQTQNSALGAANHPGTRRSRLAGTAGLLLSLVASLLWLGSAPSHATGEKWSITGVYAVGCDAFKWGLHVHREGLDDGFYTYRTQVVSDGKTYMNEGFSDSSFDNGADTWTTYSDFTYDAVDNPGTFPLTPGKPMKVVISLERPKGTVLSSWTMVAASCDSSTLLYNGPTTADLDEDYVKVPQDLCPSVRASRSNGCPLHERSLSLRPRYGPKRVVGQLYAAGHPALYAGRTVTIWKVRSGPDLRIGTRTTTYLGKFKARVGRGRYYATAPGVLVPSVGQVTADRSLVARVR